MSKKKQFPLRIDEELFNSLRKWADDEFRSLNAQIEYLLKQAAKKSGRLKKDKNK